MGTLPPPLLVYRPALAPPVVSVPCSGSRRKSNLSKHLSTSPNHISRLPTPTDSKNAAGRAMNRDRQHEPSTCARHHRAEVWGQLRGVPELALMGKVLANVRRRPGRSDTCDPRAA